MVLVGSTMLGTTFHGSGRLLLSDVSWDFQDILEPRNPTVSSTQTVSLRPILTNPDIPTSAKILAFTLSVVNSLVWQASVWTLATAEYSNLFFFGVPQGLCHVWRAPNPD